MKYNRPHRLRSPRRHWRRGSTVIQTALVLPVLISIMFGTIEYGDYFYVKHIYTGAALQGVQTAVVGGSTYATVTSAVQTSLSYANLAHNYTMQVLDNGRPVTSLTGIVAGDNVTVTISGTWGNIAGVCRPYNLINTNKIVKGAAVMKQEIVATTPSYAYTNNGAGSPTSNPNGDGPGLPKNHDSFR